MKLPVSWLKKYIPVGLSPEALEEKLTMSGSKVEAVEMKGSEAVIEIEVTTNRPDCLSVLGLAHEVSALTGKKVTVPKGYFTKETAAKRSPAFLISVEDKKACPLYTARLLKNVSIKPSSSDTQKLLELTGTRAISNAVDATNFVLFECGQPLHAFDFDKVRGGKIVVRFSRKGEKFLGIDGVEHELDAETLVIADAERPIAIAGVMGGKLTEVTSSTKNILLESAYFDPALVRQASKKYRISTDSSYRFERGVDPALVKPASARAKELILADGGEDASGLVEANTLGSKKAKPVTLRVARVEALLGMKVSQARILGILKSLCIPAKASGKEKIIVSPDTFRRDITEEANLIEEVLRIEGFDKIPVVIPPTRHVLKTPEDAKALRTLELKKFMAALGFSEIMTYSLVSSKLLKEAGFDPGKAHRVVNTISAGQEFFRPSLAPGMLEAAMFNVNRKMSSLKLFEIGNVYGDGLEETSLSVLFSGLAENYWQKKTEASFYGLKGALENILKFAGTEAAEWKDGPASGTFDQVVELCIAGKAAGRIGIVSAAAQKNFDIPHPVYFAELSLDKIFRSPGRSVRVKPVPKFPVVRRDLAFVLDESVRVSDLEAEMRKAAAPYLQDAVLFDQYIGKNIAPGKRSLAFSLAYQKDTGTFTDEEIAGLQERVGAALKSRYAVEFR